MKTTHLAFFFFGGASEVEAPAIVGAVCAHATAAIVTRARGAAGVLHQAAAAASIVTRAKASAERC